MFSLSDPIALDYGNVRTRNCEMLILTAYTALHVHIYMYYLSRIKTLLRFKLQVNSMKKVSLTDKQTEPHSTYREEKVMSGSDPDSMAPQPVLLTGYSVQIINSWEAQWLGAGRRSPLQPPSFINASQRRGPTVG